MDGVIITSLGIGVIDGTHPHAVEPAYPGIVDEIVNLGECIIWDKVSANREQIAELTSQKKQHYTIAFEHLKKAREVHHKIESKYTDAVDFDAVATKLEQVIAKHKKPL